MTIGQQVQQVEGQQEREIARQRVLYDQLKGFQGAQEKITEGVGDLLKAQGQQSAELITRFKELTDRFERLSLSHESATQAMQTASSDMKGTSSQLGVLSTNLKSASDSFSSQLVNAVEHADNITQQNKDTIELFIQLSEQLDKALNSLHETAHTMDTAAEKAEAGLTSVDRHFDSLSKSLREHVEGLESQVAKLLKGYSDTVQAQTVKRLKTWNEETNTYISMMTDAVRALSDVVDEIDGKIHSHREGDGA